MKTHDDIEGILSGFRDEQRSQQRLVRLEHLVTQRSEESLASPSAAPPAPLLAEAVAVHGPAVRFAWNSVDADYVKGYQVYRSAISDADTAVRIAFIEQPPAAGQLAYEDPIGYSASFYYWVSTVTVGDAESPRAPMWRGTAPTTAADPAVATASLTTRVTTLETFNGARVWTDATQSIANITWTSITFNQEDWDTALYHDTATNNSRLTIPAGVATAYYALSGAINWDSSGAAGIRELRFLKNGSVILAQTAQNASTSIQLAQIASTERLVAGDYIELQGFQVTGGPLNVVGATRDLCWFAIHRLGL
jgi:hypothetical protein